MKNVDRLKALVELDQERGRIEQEIARHVKQLRGTTEGGRVGWATIAESLAQPTSTVQRRYADIAPKERTRRGVAL